MRKYLLALIVLTSFQAIGQKNNNGMTIREITPEERIYCPKSDHINNFHLPPQIDRDIINKRAGNVFKDSLFNVPEEYLEAINFVFDILETHFTSEVTINVHIETRALGGSALAGAGPSRVVSNFDFAPLQNTEYPIALAEKILGREINRSDEADIVVTIDNQTDFHLIPNDPTGVNGKVDLASVLTHELLHGMGFFESGGIDAQGRGVLQGFTNRGHLVAFDRNLINGDGEVLSDDYVSPSMALADQFISNNIFYNSESFVDKVTKPKIYAPAQFAGGSSLSHLDEIYNNTGDALMTFAFAGGELIYFPGNLTLDMMRDMGWDATRILHEPGVFSEDINANYEILADVDADSGFDPATFMMHYSTDSFATEDIMVPMEFDQVSQQYKATLSTDGTIEDYQYYFEVVDGRNITRTRPGGGPEFFFNYRYGIDTEPPVMSIRPQVDTVQLFAIFNNIFLEVTAEDDFSGVESASSVIIINDEEPDTIQLVQQEFNNGNTFRGEYAYVRNFRPTDVVQYKFLSQDKSSASNMTVFPQDSFFKAVYITDTFPPELSHDQVPSVTNFDKSFNIKVNFIDNFLGVRDIRGIVRINGGESDTIDLELKMSLFGDFYEGRYTFSREFEPEDIIEYSVIASDLEFVPNVAVIPVDSAFYVIPVRTIKEPLKYYINDFNVPTNDFVGNGFSIGTAEGFSDDAIQTAHPYKVGGAGLTIDFIYELDQPIVVADVESFIEFDEIGLIEFGEDRVRWPSERFYDYAIVEARKVKGTEWFPLLDGYDCSDDDQWDAVYRSSIDGSGISSGVGDPSLFRNRIIDIQDSGDFIPGDTIIVRFRLFSDNAAAGWGWLIDNLRIQESSTSVEDFTEEVQFRIFPNPVHNDRINISLNVESSYDNAQMNIYNIYGLKVMSKSLGGIHNKYADNVDVSQLSGGMYFLEISLDQHSAAIQKFIKN